MTQCKSRRKSRRLSLPHKTALTVRFLFGPNLLSRPFAPCQEIRHLQAIYFRRLEMKPLGKQCRSGP